MNQPPVTLPPVIPRQLRAFERARRRILGLRAVAEALAALGLGIVMVALIEALVRPALSGRVFLSAAITCLAGSWLLTRLGRAWFRSVALRHLAADFERAARFPSGESIWSAVEMTEPAATVPGASRWMQEQTVARAARQIEAVNPASLIDRQPFRRSLKQAAAVAGLILLGWIAGAGGRLWLAVNPFAATSALSRIHFQVTPGDCIVTEGTNLVITIAADRLPEAAKLSATWADTGRESIPLTQTGTNLFQCEIHGVAQSFTYQVLADEAESPKYAAQVVFAPRLERFFWTVQPPAYTGWTNQIIDGGSAEFLEGSRLTAEITATRESVDHAELFTDDGVTNTLERTDSRLRLELTPANSLRFGLRLVGGNQLASATASDYTLSLLPDLPPTATLSVAGTGYGLVERDEILPLAVQATDDVGLQRVDLVILASDLQRGSRNLFDSRTNHPASGPATLRDFSVTPNFNLLDLKPNPGDELQFLVLAIDLKGQTNESAPISFTVGSLEKSLEARLAARLRALVSAMQAGEEELRVTRTSWLVAARNHREQDPAARKDSLGLIKSRLTELSLEIDGVGASLVNESKTNEIPDARFMYRLGSSLSAWAREQSGVLRRELDRVDQAPLAEALVLFNRGDDLLNLASADLTNFTHVVAVLQAALESDVLAARCEMSQGRYKRVFPVVRGEAKSVADAFASVGGLDATYYASTDLRGRILDQIIDLPHVANSAPGGRRENWSVRYEGQLNIVESNLWTLACVADDGVRLFVDGISRLPADAWGAHSATEFHADLNLTAGWHPIVIEFYQGGSESKLQFLQGLKSEPLTEVPAHRLRPKSAPEPAHLAVTNNTITPEMLDLLRSRLAASLATPATVPPILASVTNAVDMAKLTALATRGGGAAVTLSDQIATLPDWDPATSAKAELHADDLTSIATEARRLLREELDRHHWQFEGADSLKNVQTAFHELRAINEQLRRLPWNDHKQLDEPEQAQVNLAKIWERELERATADAAHQLFEQARQPDATLAERIWALNASAKAERELAPAVAKLAPKLDENRGKNQLADEISRRLDEINDRLRELNDVQERINHEHVAAVARAALPTARALARAADNANAPATDETYADARRAAERVADAERVTGDFTAAAHLDTLVGDSPRTTDAPALATELRALATRTDRNPPSLAQAIPPPMQKATDALAEQRQTPAAAADQLAVPRLAMSLEAARLNRQGDRPAATAYELLGQDLGQAISTPAALNEATLQPLTDRALALAGARGDEARQAELRAAAARAAQLAANSQSPAQLANELDSLSKLSQDAARDAAKDAPLNSRLDQLSGLAPPVRDWSESADPVEVAASAAHEAEAGLAAAPRNWEAHHQASEILGDAASQIRMNAAIQDLAGHEPFPAPPSEQASDQPGPPANRSDRTTQVDGPTGQASTQVTPRGLDQAEWARLNDRLRRQIRNTGADHFTPEQRAAIQAYFERLGSVK